MKKVLTMLCLGALGALGFQAAAADFGGTIYISKNSVGNIWAWDSAGDYSTAAWPGNLAITGMSTATKNGTEYYTFTFDHNGASNPGFLFVKDGQQTGDITPSDEVYYTYTGGTTYTSTTFTGEQPEAQFSLRGSFNGWDMTDMTKGEDGKWTITQAMAAGAEFKIYDGTNWFGGDTEGNSETYVLHSEWCTDIALTNNETTQNFQINEPGNYTLTVDPEAMTLTVTGWGDEVEEALYLIGSFNGWNETAMVPFVKGDDGKYTVTQTMAAGAQFKFKDETGAWYGGVGVGGFEVLKEYVDNATELSLVTGDEGINFIMPVEGEWTLTVDREAMKLVISGDWSTDEAMYLIGTFNGWNEETKLPLVKGEDGKWTITQTLDAAAEFKFKNEAGEWIGGDGEGYFGVLKEYVDNATELSLTNPGVNFVMPVAGEWTLTVDREAMKLVIAGEWNDDVTVDDVYVLGEVNGNGWAPNAGAKMAYDQDKALYTLDITAAGENDGYSYFSFTTKLADDAEDWDGIAANRFGAVSEGDFWVTEETLGTELSLTYEGGQAFRIPAGDYKLTLDLAAMTLVIDGEWNAEYPNVYVLGEVNDNGGWFANVGTEMETEDGEVYTATITTAGENEGYSYFSFTTKLADDAEDWDAIAASRFGAVSEGDFWVTEEMIGVDLSLTYEGGQAYKIEAGTYNLTLNLKDMTLVIATESGVKGDVTGDGNVDIDDVNAIVNMMLELKNKTAAADVNGDGNVDVDDLNLVVNIMLSL